MGAISEQVAGRFFGVLHGESYKGLAPPRKTTKHKTPTVYTKDGESSQFTDQAPGTGETAAHESSRVTPTSTSTVHIASTTNPGLHHKPCRVIATVLSADATQFELQAGAAALLHRSPPTSAETRGNQLLRLAGSPGRGVWGWTANLRSWWSAMDAQRVKWGRDGGRGG